MKSPGATGYSGRTWLILDVYKRQVIAIVISLLVTKFLIPKKYESMARIYLKPNITESGTIDYNTLTANSKMVNNYVLMLQGNSLLEDVTEKLKLEDEALVKNSLSVSNEADSEIITVSARTVSYTHLDVYKRQMLFRMKRETSWRK